MSSVRYLAAPTGRHPMEVLLLFYGVVSGTGYLLGAPPPTSISEVLPDGVRQFWYVMLILGGVVGFVGIWFQGRVNRLIMGLKLEIAALLLLAGGVLIYSTAIFGFAGWAGLGAGALNLAYGVACVWQVIREARVLSEIPREDEDRQ